MRIGNWDYRCWQCVDLEVNGGTGNVFAQNFLNADIKTTTGNIYVSGNSLNATLIVRPGAGKFLSDFEIDQQCGHGIITGLLGTGNNNLSLTTSIGLISLQRIQ